MSFLNIFFKGETIKKNKLFIIIPILVFICLIAISAICNQCTGQIPDDDKKNDAETEVAVSKPVDPGLEHDEPVLDEEKKHSYSDQELEYFFETAIGAEFGSIPPLIHKWTDNIRIKVNGNPTSTDLDVLNQVISELSLLLGGITIDIVGQDPNIEVYFTTIDQFSSIEPGYVSGNMGFFWVWWDSNGVINMAKILIAIDEISQQERSHLIREELTQSLGIMNDSYSFEDSIFYQGWTDTINYLPIDRTIISLLYDPRLKSGMTQEQVRSILGTP